MLINFIAVMSVMNYFVSTLAIGSTILCFVYILKYGPGYNDKGNRES